MTEEKRSVVDDLPNTIEWGTENAGLENAGLENKGTLFVWVARCNIITVLH